MLFFIILLANKCCANKAPLRIYGGIDAKSEEYPFVVRIEALITYNFTNNSITTDHEHLCTASALSPVWLISAAHCFEENLPITVKKRRVTIIGKMVIRYGHVENSYNDLKDSFSDVLYTVPHPQYTDRTADILLSYSKSDIGLLKTDPIKIGTYMKISAVDYKSVYGHEAVVGGFGIMANKVADGILLTDDTLVFMKPLQLLKVLLTKCRHDSVAAPAVCLSPRCGETTSACPGDSGGPVIHPSGLLGVIVIGTSTCKGEIKRTFTAAIAIPLSPYIEWIYSHVNA